MSRRSEEYELLTRASSDSIRSLPSSGRGNHNSPSFSWYLRLSVWICAQLPPRPTRIFYSKISSSRKSRRLLLRAVFWLLVTTPCLIISLIAFTAALNPSYTHPPDHYKVLQKKCQGPKQLGRGNINNEKIFIAATLYDVEGALVDGNWGSAVLELVNLLGPDNVHLSVYENDPDAGAKASLESLAKDLSCKSLFRTPTQKPCSQRSV